MAVLLPNVYTGGMEPPEVAPSFSFYEADALGFVDIASIRAI